MNAVQALEWMRANRPAGVILKNGDCFYWNGTSVDIDTPKNTPRTMTVDQFLWFSGNKFKAIDDDN